MRVSDRY